MNFYELFVLSLKSVFLHKLRSILATLGIVFGVGAVISMASINQSARRESLQQYQEMGVRNIRIKSRKPAGKQEKSVGQGRVIEYGLKKREIEHLNRIIPDISDYYVVRTLKKKTRYRDRIYDINILSASDRFFTLNDLSFKEGHPFSSISSLVRVPVCVLGNRAARAIFNNRSAVGKEINLGEQYFKVIGVLKASGYTGSLSASDGQNFIVIPFSTAKDRYGKYNVIRQQGQFEVKGVEVHEAALQVNRVDRVDTVASAIRSYFKREHPTGDYEITVPLELLRQRRKTIRIFNIVMLSIASISLLVGGIGIMNIMLANVAERTKEIGTRRALGAKKRDIAIQFLIESLTLCLAGSLLGIIVSVGLTYLITLFSDFQFGFSYLSMGISILVSSLVGIIFGTYPALQAARLDPLEALRKE